MTSYQKPTAQAVKDAYVKLTNISLRRHFFSKLNNPFWVQPLLDMGVYDKPPEPLKEGNMVRFLDWPELDYLERVATEVPNEVHKAISNISTDNYIIQRAAIEIAQKLPPDLAAKFTLTTLIGWYKGDALISAFTAAEIAKLAKLLAENNEEAALEIADKLIFTFVRVKDDTYERLKPKIWEQWHFNEAVKIFSKALSHAFPQKYLELLCHKLKNYLQMEGQDQGQSLYWRQAIEENEQDEYGDEVKGTLVDCIRDTAKLAISEHSFDPYKVLEKFGLSIIRRVEFFLAGETGANDKFFLERALKSADIFWEMEFHREIFHFLRNRFLTFGEEEKTAILEMIFRGPPDGKFVEGEKARKYAAIAEHLTGKYKEEYDKFPKDPHPDFHIYSEGVWTGPTSPLEDSDIENKSVEEVVKFLAEWKPKGGWREATPRGLGRSIEADVKKQPAKYVYSLTSFQINQPTYVSHVFSGIRFAENLTLDEKAWDNILCLCEWVISQPIIIGRTVDDDFDEDPNWQWTRHAIVSLLHSKMRTAPLKFRPRIWAVVSSISQDDDPTVEAEQKSLKSDWDAYGLAINSTKGEALHAAVEYGLWLHNLSKDNKTPELFELIDSLAKNNFNGLKVPRAVIGRFFPWLNLMSPEWALRNVDFLFDESTISNFSACWIPYISHCNAYTDLFPVLEKKYLFALDHQKELSNEKKHYDSRLAGHVVMFYLREKINYDSPLMKKVLSGTTEKEVFDNLGRWLDKEMYPPLVKRAIELWDLYFAERVRGKTITDEQRKILSGFSFWVESPLLDTQWKLDYLQELIKMKVPLKDAMGICDGLAEATETHLSQVLAILKDLITENSIDHFVLMHKDEIQQILEKGHASNLADQKLTDKIVNIMGEKGYKGFERYLLVARAAEGSQ